MEPTAPARPRRIVPLIIASALFMENLDSTIIATALPSIAASLDESPLRLSLAITCYLFSLAVFIPISGWVADRFGARNVLRLGIAVFVAGSIGCGLSQSLGGFVLARSCQGMGGAMMMPVGRLILLRSTPKSELIQAMAWMTMPALVGPVLGPPIGGFITTYFSWHWIFWINVPIGIIGILLVTRFIPRIEVPRPPPFDGLGFLMCATGLIGVVASFETIGREVLPGAAILTLFAAGAAMLALYTRHAMRVASPVLDLRLLQVASYRDAQLGAFLFRMGVGAIPFLLPMMLQLGFGLSAFQSGLLTFTSAVGAMSMKATARPIVRLFGFRPVLLVNAVVSSVLLGCIGLFQPTTPYALIVGVLLVGGFFRSLQFTCVNAVTYAEIEPAQMSRATSFASMAQQLSLSVGAGTGALLLHLTTAASGEHGLAPGDFMPAFLAVALISACSLSSFVRLPADVAADMAGRAKSRPAE
ncbi:MAG TPA: MFS transporter [Geminicoccaceae bacterium]|nr:MFS transporter [Geminicoccus sp.]HMU50939.1 MFS transporter [Geminicoccaceae bacterium]